eukprot:XP_001690580.1 predicted protein [Chlamydomonas reinhardtii]
MASAEDTLDGGSSPAAPYIAALQGPPSGAAAAGMAASSAPAAAAGSGAGWLALPGASPMGRGGRTRAQTVSLAAVVAVGRAEGAAGPAAESAAHVGLLSANLLTGSPGAAAGSFAGWSGSVRALPSCLQLPGASGSAVIGTGGGSATGIGPPPPAPAAAAAAAGGHPSGYLLHSATSITRLQQVQVGLWRDVHCLAPERLTDPTSPPSTAADVYALGAIMHEMAYGEAPWAGMSAVCVAVGAATGDMRITCTQPLALACITELIERCTSPEPKERPCLAEVLVALTAATEQAAAARDLVVLQRQERETRRLEALLMDSSSSVASDDW